MIRALLELLVTIIVAMAARAIFSSVMKGFVRASQGGFAAANSGGSGSDQPSGRREASAAGELHKDPVCGTYVAESSPHRRQTLGQVFYYCSEACKEKHALVAR